MAYAYQPQQAWQPYPARSTAPVSLHVVAIFQYLMGLLTLGAAALMALALARVAPEWHMSLGAGTYTTRPGVITTATYVVIGIVASIGLIAIVLGRKVQRGRNWARIVLTGLNAFSVAGGVWQGYTTGAAYAATLTSIALPLLFVVLLNTRAARGWCRYGTY
ncbi:hypothetical protein [Dactylosporangium sp. CA-139066]|uniref:hypothetical protein n=1 Tax=Dactylosporangium sp. CA-139066 TaxID=3239930 RepID=UPI003D9052F5